MLTAAEVTAASHMGRGIAIGIGVGKGIGIGIGIGTSKGRGIGIGQSKSKSRQQMMGGFRAAEQEPEWARQDGVTAAIVMPLTKAAASGADLGCHVGVF